MNIKVDNSLRLGLTMRVASPPDYDEQRDCLAQDWARFIGEALPEAAWLALPNIGSHVIEYARQWRINALILSGGNDPGESPLRDATEKALLEYALEYDVPLVGVCRGLQLMQHFFGGPISPCASEQHVANRHDVHFTEAFPVPSYRGKDISVNSFHCFGLRQDNLCPELIPMAVVPGGWIEGVRTRKGKSCAVMWHPERETTCSAMDKALFRTWLGLEMDHAG